MRLRQRYLIREIQQRDRYACTYLALDQERFNRPCVVTEFPLQSANRVTQEKLLERFRQAAYPLFQLNHPQLPHFFGAFRQRQSLFLAHNHAQGVSYRELLNVRQKQGKALTEPEVVHLLMHLLPVLSELHQLEIIHGKISPDCILLPVKPPRSVDALYRVLQHEAPHLVGLGAVDYLGQTLAMLQDGRNAGHWSPGQPGYAPPEQLQTGKLSPSSDIYALAVTTLVLLTGRPPQDLLDSHTLTWSWQAHVTLSPSFEVVLQKMLAWQPVDRYPTAQAALEEVRVAFHKMSLHTVFSRSQDSTSQVAAGLPTALQQPTIDSRSPKSPSRATGFAKLRQSAPRPRHRVSGSRSSQAFRHHTSVAHALSHPPSVHHPQDPQMPFHLHSSDPLGSSGRPETASRLEMAVVIGLSLGALAIATALTTASFAPVDALSSGRTTWLQQIVAASQSTPNPETSSAASKRWQLPRLAWRRSGSQARSSGEKLDFAQPMIVTPANSVREADRSVEQQMEVQGENQADRKAELQALQAGLEDIPVPIYFSPGQPAQTVSGTLYELRHQSYLLVGEAGQKLMVQLDAVDAELSILDAYKRPLALDAELTQHWQGELPGGDRYYIRIIGKGEYRLHVQLQAPEDLAE